MVVSRVTVYVINLLRSHSHSGVIAFVNCKRIFAERTIAELNCADILPLAGRVRFRSRFPIFLFVALIYMFFMFGTIAMLGSSYLWAVSVFAWSFRSGGHETKHTIILCRLVKGKMQFTKLFGKVL